MPLRLRTLKLSQTPLRSLPFLLHTKSLNPKPFSSSFQTPSDACPPEWTDEILYLDESGGVICSGRGLRPAEPGCDGHVLAGGLRRPLPRSTAVAKLVDLARRWCWGPDLDAHLDRLPFTPDPSVLDSALASLPDADPEPSLSLFRWARRQPWFAPSDAAYSLLLHRLYVASDVDAVHSLFEDILKATTFTDGVLSPTSFSSSLNLAIQYLCRTSKLEVSFCCFKKLRDLGYKDITTQTYNSLITLFLNKGLPYKAFEIYESMEASGCSLDVSTDDLMVPVLAKSGRLDAALRLFEEMKRRDGGGRPG